MSSKSFEFEVDAAFDGREVKTFLKRGCGFSTNALKAVKYRPFGITRNEIELKANEKVFTGDVIVTTFEEDQNEIVPVQGKLDILFEDDYLLAVNKPAYLPVHPTKKHQEDTLANFVAFYQLKKGECCTFRAINRLDMDTSGIVIMAKDVLTYGRLFKQVEKEYLAVVDGLISQPGTIDAPIALEDGSRMKRKVRADGARAITHYQPLRADENHTLLKLRLETGRTHQIRCHMAYLEHPLVGDPLYGEPSTLINRQALHCATARFQHPFSGMPIELKAKLPDDFEALLASMTGEENDSL